MAVIVLIDPEVTIDGVDMSTYIKEVSLEVEADDVETTTFQSGGWKTRLPGLKSGEVSFTFNTDYDASTVDDRLWGWFGTSVTFAVRGDLGAVSATNPEYQGTAVALKMMPLAGSVGDLNEQQLTWPMTGILTRATS